MKKICVIMCILTAAAMLCGCGETENKASKPETESSVITSSEQEPASENELSAPESSDVDRLPDGLTLNGTGMLRYTSPSGEMEAVFPNELCYVDDEYRPEDGIYLHNSDGTATLLLEAVNSVGVRRATLIEYLKEKYPDAEIYISDTRNIVCRTEFTDNSGRRLKAFMKAKISNNGYNEAILCFRPEDIGIYDNIFARITLL